MGLDRPLAAACLAAMLALATANASAQIPGLQRKWLIFAPGSTSLGAREVERLQRLPAEELSKRMDAVLAERPDDLAARALQGFAESAMDHEAAAIADFDVVLAAGMLDPTAREMLLSQRAEDLLFLQRYAEAIANADEAIALDASDGFAFFARGWARFQLKQYPAAMADLQRASSLEPAIGIGHYRLAMVLDVSGDHARALQEFAEATRLAPDDLPTRLAYADSLIARNQIAGALEQLDAAARLAPRDSSILAQRADVKSSLGRNDEALVDADRAVDLAASGAGPQPASNDDLVEALLARARIRYTIGPADNALTDVSRALVLDPQRVDAIFLRARIELSKSQLTEARQDVDKVMSLVPDSADAYDLRSSLELAANQHDAALADAARAVELEPDNANARQQDGFVLVQFGENQKAVAQYDEAIRLAPNVADSWFRRGLARVQLKDPAAAVSDFTHVIDMKAQPQLVEAYLDRGWARLDLKDYAGAISDLTQAIGMKPAGRLPEAYLNRGTAYYRGGDLAYAATDFRMTASLAPTDATSRKDLGAVLEEQHDFAGAADAFAQSLALQDEASVRDAVDRMRVFNGQFGAAAESYRASVSRSTSSRYTPLWRYVARIRANVADETSAREELARNVPPHDPREWIDSLTDFMIGRIDAKTLRQAADAAAPDKRVGDQCEADYYTAELLIAHHDAPGAKPLLDEAVQICPPKFFEARGAVAELALQRALGGFQ